MGQKKIFASFMLDGKQGLEIALPVEAVQEAIPAIAPLKPLPSAVPFLEGIMELRGSILPVVNLKKRFGLDDSSYGPDCRTVIVQIHNQSCGLMVDDISDVLWVYESDIIPVNPALQSDDKIISSCIKRPEDNRIFEIIDLNHLFPEGIAGFAAPAGAESPGEERRPRRYSRFVAFVCGDQEYGLPVENAREVTFISGLNETFKSGAIAGDVRLRNRSVPVVNASYFFSEKEEEHSLDERSRILIFSVGEGISTGLIVDSLVGIVSVGDDEVLPLPGSDSRTRAGIYQGDGSRNMILLDIEQLLADRLEELKSVANISTVEESGPEKSGEVGSAGLPRHLVISQNSYLIVTIGKHFAFQLKDIQEIIEAENVMHVPGTADYSGHVVNLRGDILPVIDLREFYSYPGKDPSLGPGKLVICGTPGGKVAFEVDGIVTIYKQENYYQTPSLNSQLEPKRDTLDRLIEFVKEDGAMEHVLVINVYNLFNNYLNIYKKEAGGEFVFDSARKDMESKGMMEGEYDD